MLDWVYFLSIPFAIGVLITIWASERLIMSPHDAVENLNSTLKTYFVKTFEELTIIPVNDLWLDVLNKYSESWRFYHNLNHIAECLNELRTLSLSPEEDLKIELAIWFHDIIYNRKSSTNEEDSAHYFQEQAKNLNISSQLVESVVNYILSTKNHNVSNTCEDKSLKLFLDIDLSILGADTQRFLDYDKAIRQEYSWVPGFLYNAKRKSILKSFLKKDTIFKTPEFFEKYEGKARKNILLKLKKS